MPTFKYESYTIYYECHGIGKPLLFCNGIMMSTASWHLLMPPIIEHHQLILVDLIDQGKSSEAFEPYDQWLQVEVIKALLDHLSIEQVDLMGISYGGEVAQLFVGRYPDYVNRLILANTVSYTNAWLRDIGEGWNEVARMNAPLAYYYIAIPVIYSSSFYHHNHKWMKERQTYLVEHYFTSSFFERMIRLTDSAAYFDARSLLSDINHPTLIIGGGLDSLTPLNEQATLHQLLKNSKLVEFPNVGHASMYEDAHLFISTVLGFLSLDQMISVI